MIEIPPPAYNPEVVVTSHFNPDSIWTVALHQSSSIGTKQDVSKQYESDASITGSSTFSVGLPILIAYWI